MKRNILIPLLVIFATAMTTGAKAWRYRTLDSQGNVGESCRITLNQKGYPAIAYYSYSGTLGRGLALTWEDGEGWHKELIDGGSIKAHSMQFDSQNRLHIVYFDSHSDMIKYGVKTNNTWDIKVFDSGMYSAEYFSLALDSKDCPHFVYADQDNDILRYATKKKQGWESETLFQTRRGDYYCSLVIDHLDHVYFTFLDDEQSYNIYLFHHDGFSWSSEIVRQGIGNDFWTPEGCTFAMHQGSGKLGMAYTNGWNNMYFGENQGDGWNWITLVSKDSPGYDPSLCYDYFGFPHLVYFDRDNDCLKYAYKDKDGWHKEVVLSTSRNYIPYITANRVGEAHFCYYDYRNGDLDYIYPAAYGPAAFDLIDPDNGAWVFDQPFFMWYPASYQGEDILTYEILIDGQVGITNIPAVTHFARPSLDLSDGFHTWQVQAITNDGDKILSSETWSIRVDNSAPDPFALIAPANNSWTNKSIPLIWQPANDTGSQLSHYQLYINDQLTIDQIPPAQNSIDLPPIRDDGAYTWSIRAVDHAGNSRGATPRRLNVDQTGPDAFTILAPENHSRTGDSLQEFRWKATADAGIGLQHYRLIITNDPNQRQVIVDSSRYKPAEDPLSHGLVSWRVQAFDSLGNCTETNQHYFNVDLKPPTAFSLMTPKDSSCVALPTPDFTWSASADAGSGLSGYQLWIDGQLNRDQISGNSSAPSGALSEGPHTWFVRAVDNVGNYRQSPQRLVYCDWNAPVAPQLVFPQENQTTVSTFPVFRWSGGRDAGSGIASAGIFIDGQKAGTVLHPDTLFIAPQPVQQGNHTWWVTVLDRAGNQKSSSVGSFKVDTTLNSAPRINPIADIAIDEGEPLVLQVSATDHNDTDLLRYYDDTDLFDIGLLSGVINFTPTMLQTGEYDITIIATDGHLSDSTRFTLTIGDVNHAPESFSLLLPADGAEIDTLNPEFIWQAAQDPDAGDSLYYKIQLSADSTFSRIIYTESCTDSAFALLITLANHSTYYWRVCAFDRDKASCCCSSDFSFKTKVASHIIAIGETGAIDSYQLLQNYPNPFNATTTIEFSLPKASHVKLGIYNLQGQCINVLADQQMPAGRYRYHWNGTDMKGGAVTSGIYFYNLGADGFDSILRMMFVR